MNIDRYKTCETVAVQLGLATDISDAGEQCKDPAFIDSTLNQAKADPALGPSVPYTGNIMWDVLSADQNLDAFDKQLVMSITGTTLYFDPGTAVNGQAIQSIPSVDNLTASALINGTDGTGTDSSGNINLQLYSCSGACMNPVLADTQTKSIKARVMDVMMDLSGAISGNQPPSPTATNFVNNVPVPVYQLLSVANSIPNADIPAAKINQYSEYVAVEFAYALLSRAVTVAKRAALPGGSLNGMKLSEDQVRKLQAHAKLAVQLEVSLNAERHLAAVRAQSFITMAQDIEQLQRSMRTTMPQQITNMLGYARANPIH
jgi:conjugative transfer pilus assembly protein TraH